MIVNPLIAWGSAEDLTVSPWSSSGTLTVTGGQADPFGGTSAVSLNDTDGAAQSVRYRTVAYTVNGTQQSVHLIKQGTSTRNFLQVYDNTAATARHTVQIDWTGGVPALTTSSGAGTLYSVIAVGASFYLIHFRSNSIVAANTNYLRIFAAGSSTSDTGSLIIYRRNAVIVPVTDMVVRRRKKRAGHEVVQGASGLEDAWDAGDDHWQGCDIRHIPDRDENSPDNCSGFDGLNEATGVNCGFDAMLKAGQNKTVLVWVPDRTDLTTYTSSYMVEPMEDGIGLEPNNPNYRTFHLELRNTVSPYVGWMA